MIERSAVCACGQVRAEAVASGALILSAACCCTDRQAGGRLIEARPDAAPIRDAVGATPYLIYRNDRFAACVAGEDTLGGDQAFSRTRRPRAMWASCCNSGDVSQARPRLVDLGLPHPRHGRTRRPSAFRNKTASLPEGTILPKDIPAYRGFPFKLIRRLMLARLAMMLTRRSAV